MLQVAGMLQATQVTVCGAPCDSGLLLNLDELIVSLRSLLL